MSPNYHPSLTDGTFDKPRPAVSPASSPTQKAAADGQQRLGTLSRKDGGEELRIERREFNGYPYIDLRVWFKGDDGEFRPTKTGVTVKPHELEQVIAALSKAREGKPR